MEITKEQARFLLEVIAKSQIQTNLGEVLKGIQVSPMIKSLVEGLNEIIEPKVVEQKKEEVIGAKEPVKKIEVKKEDLI